MNNSKVIALVGAAVMIVGLFLPVATVFGININLLTPPGGGVSWEGLVVLACAALGGILAMVGQTRFAVLPAVAALAFLVWKYMEMKDGLNTATGASEEVAARVAEVASLNILGWAVMGIGALIMLAAGAMAFKNTGSVAPPPAV